jgi:hypothetical protein
MDPEERIDKNRYREWIASRRRMGLPIIDGHQPYAERRYRESVKRPGSMEGVPEKLDEARTLAPAFTEEYYRSNPHRRNSPVQEPRRVYSPEEMRRLMQYEAKFGSNNLLNSLQAEQDILDNLNKI